MELWFPLHALFARYPLRFQYPRHARTADVYALLLVEPFGEVGEVKVVILPLVQLEDLRS